MKTSVKEADCALIAKAGPDDEGDFYEALCPSYGGYQVEVSGADIRYNLKLKLDGQSLINEYAGGAFHRLEGDSIEWRYKLKKGPLPWDGELSFTSLIYTLSFSSISKNGEPINDQLIHVVRLNGAKSCVLGRLLVSSIPNAMDEARKIADNENSACSKSK